MTPAARIFLLDLQGTKKSDGSTGHFYFSIHGQEQPPIYNGHTWLPRAQRLFDMQVDAFAGGDGEADPRPIGGRSIPKYSDLQILNGDGALDTMLAEYAFLGTPYTLYGGRVGDAWPFPTLHTGTVIDWETDGKVVTFKQSDLSDLLDQPVQPNLYGGTGGLDGTADLKGKPKPLLFGERSFFAPVLIGDVGGTPVYQIHDGALLNVTDVYERSLKYGSGSYIVSVADVLTWTPVVGKVAVDLTHGVMRLPKAPAGVITVTARREVPAVTGSETTHANVMADAVLHSGLLTSGDLDATAFATLHGLEPNGTSASILCGYLIQDARTVAAALDELCASCGALWTFTDAGTLRVQQVAFGTPHAQALTDALLTNQPRRQSTPPPVWRVRRKWNPIRAHTADEISPLMDLPAVPSSGTSSVTGGTTTSFTLDTASETQWSTDEGAYIGREVELSVNPATTRTALIQNYHMEAAIARVTITATLPAALSSATKVRLLPQAGLGSDARAYLMQEWRTKAVSPSATTKTRYPRARDPERAFFHVLQADADTEAGRHRSLESVPRDRWVVEVRDRLFVYQLGDTVTWTSSRYGLGSGKNFLVLGKREDVQKETTTLTLWGPSA